MNGYSKSTHGRKRRPTAAIFSMAALAAIASSACVASANTTPTSQPVDEIDNPHLWEAKTKSVAVFKNGFGFFMREGDVKLHDGWCTAREVPPATFGTLAIYSHNENQIVDIVGAGPGEVIEFDGHDAPKDNAARRARLETSMNLKVSLNYKQKEADRSATGKIISVGPEYVILENANNSFAVPIDGISRMQVLELPVRAHVVADGGKSPAQTTLGMAYLRQGIIWIPEYTLKVLDDESAELTLRGSLINEAEDLVHCDVHFVVGVPNFLHTDHLAPIAMGTAIRTIGSAIAPAQVRSQLISNNLIFSNSNTGGANDTDNQVLFTPGPDNGSTAINNLIGNLPQMEGAAASDFTVYTKEDLTLRRGEKAVVTLFVKKIKYSHVYRWTPPERMKHYLMLLNETDTAWTTGPCLALSAQRPLSEDLLRYTPRGGRCEIPVTAAINIAHDKTESEIDRELKAHSPAKDKYLDRVELEGELKLRNFEKQNVTIHINAPMSGKPTSASDGGTVLVDTSNLRLVERSGSAQWKIELKPGEGKTLKYRYERYVQSD